MTIPRRYACAVFTTLALMLPGSRVQADLIAYDPFGSPAIGDPLVQVVNPATGFSDDWHTGGVGVSLSANYTIASSSLAYGGLATSGNHVSTSAEASLTGATRTLSTALGTPGTTDYFSVLLRPDGALSGGLYNNFFGLYLNSSTGNDIFIGKPGSGPIGNYDLENRGGTGQVDSGVAAVTGQAALLVLRVDFAAGADTLTLYVNPTPGDLEPAMGAVKMDTDIGSVTGLTLYSTGAHSVDEIRVGTTFADVTRAVPEPSSAVLLALGGLGALAAAIRSRAASRS